MMYDQNELSRRALESVYGEVVSHIQANYGASNLVAIGFVNDGFNLDYVIVQFKNASFACVKFDTPIRLLDYGPSWSWFKRKNLANERKALPHQLLCKVLVCIDDMPVPDILDTLYLAVEADIRFAQAPTFVVLHW